MKRNEEYVKGEKLGGVFFQRRGSSEVCELLGKSENSYCGDFPICSDVVDVEPWIVLCGNDWYKFPLLKRASFEETDCRGDSL